jgi:cytochrome c biogenesis protein CcdA
MNYGAILMIAFSIGFGVLIFLAGRWITNWFFRINKIVTELEAINRALKSINGNLPKVTLTVKDSEGNKKTTDQ